MATWNRKVSYNATTGYLECSVIAPNPGPPPTRSDTATDITTHPADRPATINYHADTNVDLTGLSAKTGYSAPGYSFPGGNTTGNLLQVSDDGTDTYSYYVQGTVTGQTGTKQTEDPMIHNSAT